MRVVGACALLFSASLVDVAAEPLPRTNVLSPACSTGGTGAGNTSTCRSAAAAIAASCSSTPDVPCVVQFEPGLYLWDSSEGAVVFSDLRAGVVLESSGARSSSSSSVASSSQVEFQTFGRVLNGLFKFSNVIGGIAITGPFSVDTVRQPYTFGQVTAVASGEFSLAFNATDYPFTADAVASAPWLLQATNLYGAIDPVTRVPKLPMYWGAGGALTIVDPARGLLNVSRALDPRFEGEWLVVEHSRSAAAAFDFFGCENVTLREVTLYSHAGFGILMTQVHDILLDRVSVRARSTRRPMSIMADGAHFRKCSGRLHIMDSEFSRNGDDGLATHSEYSSVVALPNASCVQVTGEGVDLAVVGEEWIFRTHALLQSLGTRHVTSVVASGGSGKAQPITEAKVMCFDAALPERLAVGDVLTATASPQLLVERSRYWGNLGHALRIKTPNAMVRASELGFNSFGSILMIPDAHHWMSSMVVSNVTVENCSITCGDPWATAQYDVDPAGVAVTAYGSGGIVTSGTVNDRVTFRNNTITQAPGVCTAIVFRATANYTVSNNTLVWPTSAPPGCPVVHELNSDGVVDGNVCLWANGTSYNCTPQML